MYELLIDPFLSNSFMAKALIAGLLVVVATSVVGTWVVLRGMSFLGDALAHGVLPGIAIAFVIGVDPAIGAIGAALVMVFSLNAIRANSPLPEDTSIGVLFVGFLSLAVVILSARSGSWTGDINRFLFGSITGIDNGDITRQAIAAVATIIGVIILYRPLLTATFDETHAAIAGFNPRVTHLALLVLLAGSIVASFETVGNLLVFAFLVAPPATAALLVRRVPMMMVTAVGLGSVAVYSGLLISFHYGTAGGATMALVSVSMFIATMFIDSIRRSVKHRSVIPAV